MQSISLDSATAATPEPPPRVTAKPVRRPHIPSEYHHLDGFRAFLSVVRAVGAFVVGSVLAGLVVTQDWPLALRIACIAPLVLISGHGLHMMGFAGHEGVHCNLHRNKRFSALLAVLISAPVPTYTVMGYGVNHWNHHRFTNRNPDPDAHVYYSFKSFWSRMI